MSIDVLQKKIRKLKNPTVLHLAPTQDLVPEGRKTGEYCCALLEEMRDIVPAVRVSYDTFCLLGPEGLAAFGDVMQTAAKLGYFVILDWMHQEDPQMANWASWRLLGQGTYPCDGICLCSYAGSESVKPYIAADGDRAIFVSVRTGNKSGSELQDLQTGGRQVYTAAADLISRWGGGQAGRCGYCRVAAITGAGNVPSLRTLREKYPKLFLLVEGLETPGANAKNCSYAFDRLGHGAAVCGGKSIVGAWQEIEGCEDPVAAARDAAERMKRNLSRYVTVL